MRKYHRSAVCPSCGGEKTPQSELCQKCRRTAQTEGAASPEDRRKKRAEEARQKRLNDPEGTRAKAREYNEKHGRKYFLKHKFGLTLEMWDALLIEHSGLCYLCERAMQGVIHTDHDHACCPGKKSCGKCIRGLTCQKCNQGVGQFDDNPELMLRVAANLEAANRRLRN